MDMPWYAWLSSAIFIWTTGFMAGRGSGVFEMVKIQTQAQAKLMQIPGLPPNMPGPGGH